MLRFVGGTGEQTVAVDLTDDGEVPDAIVDIIAFDFDPVTVGFVEGLEDRYLDGVESVDDASEPRRS